MSLAVDIDFTLTRMSGKMKEKIKEQDPIILTSYLREIGTRKQNFQYRVKQLRKMGFVGGDYSVLAIAEGNTREIDLKSNGKAKAELCKILGITLMYEDEPQYINEIKEVCNVIKV